jgi:hypothetical protein
MRNEYIPTNKSAADIIRDIELYKRLSAVDHSLSGIRQRGTINRNRYKSEVIHPGVIFYGISALLMIVAITIILMP